MKHSKFKELRITDSVELKDFDALKAKHGDKRKPNFQVEGVWAYSCDRAMFGQKMSVSGVYSSGLVKLIDGAGNTTFANAEMLV